MLLKELVKRKLKKIRNKLYLKIRDELIKLPIRETVIFEYNAKVYTFCLADDSDQYLEDFLVFFGDEYNEALYVLENDIPLSSDKVDALLTDEFLNYLLN